MMRFVIVVAMAVLLAACKESGPESSQEKTPGGISYALLRTPGVDKVAIRIAWPGDWSARPDVNQAVPYIGANLILSGGAEGYRPGETNELFTDMKAEGQLIATADNIQGSLVFPREQMDKVLPIANAHLRAPAFDAAWLERARGGLAARVNETRSQPAAAGFEAARWAVFGNAPLREALSLDRPGIVQAVTAEEIATWHRETLTRNGAIVVVSGDLDSKTAGAAIDTLLNGLPEKVATAAKRAEGDFTPRRILIHRPEARISVLTFVGRLPSTREGNEFEDLILAIALGGDDKSVLFDAMRTKLRASYGFGGGIDAYDRQHRLLVMSGQVETSRVAEAEKTVREAYAAFRQNGPVGNLAERKKPFEERLKTASKDPQSIALSSLLAILDGQNPDNALKIGKWLEDVSDQSIRRRLDEAFPKPDGFIVVAVSPDAQALPGACVITEPKQAMDCK